MLARRVRTRKKARRPHPASLLAGSPVYGTRLGAAYCGDAKKLIKLLPSRSVDAIVTSPPYALHFKKAYGNPSQDSYVDWFLGFAPEFRRVLKPRGSLVIEIGGAWNRGHPTRSVYHFELLVRLVKEARFHLAEEFFWFNRARMPSPAEWVNVQRIRVKDAVTPIWWLSPSRRASRVEMSASGRLPASWMRNRAARPSEVLKSCCSNVGVIVQPARPS